MKAQERKALLQTLQERFEQNMHRHAGTAWADVLARLEQNPDAIRSLREMEQTGGEPDVIAHDAETGGFTFCDCSPESPAGRRSLCYDRAASTRARSTSRREAPSRSPLRWASTC